MSKAKAIVIGAGGISRAWFPKLTEQDVEVVGVMDLKIDAAEAAIDRWELTGARAFDDIDALLAAQADDADFAVDLTIPDAHCQVTCACLEAGLHVVGEKPMAASMDQARQMVAASEKSDRLYFVSQSRRWDPKHEAIRRFIETGTLGGLTTATCQFYLGAHFGGFRAAMDHVLLLDMAIHHFDLARMFTGKDPVAVYAEEFNPAGSWFDHGASAMCIFEMSDGVRFGYQGSWCSEGRHTNWNGNWRLVCQNGSVITEDDGEPRGFIVNATEGLVRHPDPVDVPQPDMPHTGQAGAIAEMLQFLKDGTTPQCECRDNIKSLAMVFGAVESAESGQRVDITALL